MTACPEAPNVVMIVLDDLGFADLGCYGSEIETPTIDVLAREGLRYNQFHVTAICSATRACLLTGRNHHAVGMGHLTRPTTLPGYTARIPRSAGSLARHLRDGGYNTFAVGKWHLTPDSEMSPAGPFDRWPLGMGFERYYGFLGGHTDQWAPRLVRDNGYVDPPSRRGGTYHLTEDLATEAIRVVRSQRQNAPDRPFFLYFATGAVHWPHHVPDNWTERYRHRYDDGWEAIRAERYARQRKLDMVPRGTAATDRPPWVPPWDELPAATRRLFSRQMEVYAGFLTHTDAQIGRLVDFLASIDALDNTLLMVLSDNGASGDGGPNGALSNQMASRVNDIEPMLSRVGELGTDRAYNHYAWGWAWAGNTPFRLWKLYTWLGGVRVPMVVHWPRRIRDDSRGRVRGQFCHAIDVMPTVLDASGVGPADVLDGEPQRTIDGESILRTFDDASADSPRSTQYFEMMGSRAIYHAGWKATTDHVNDLPAQRALVEGSRDFDRDRWSLFNLAEDFAEAHDLAASHPDRLDQLVELWWSEAESNQVLPLMDDAETRPEVTRPHRPRYVLLPDVDPVTTPPLAAGFSLGADIELPSHDAAGVICAQGDRHGGWVCYVVGGRLVATFTLAVGDSQVVADHPLPPGRHDVGLRYQPGPDGAGTATVTVAGREIAARRVPTDASTDALGYEPISIGRDRGLSVSADYQSPFPFTGRIHRVVLEIL
jgi:arylsulfatase A-like enzyme